MTEDGEIGHLIENSIRLDKETPVEVQRLIDESKFGESDEVKALAILYGQLDDKFNDYLFLVDLHDFMTELDPFSNPIEYSRCLALHRAIDVPVRNVFLEPYVRDRRLEGRPTVNSMPDLRAQILFHYATSQLVEGSNLWEGLLDEHPESKFYANIAICGLIHCDKNTARIALEKVVKRDLLIPTERWAYEKAIEGWCM